MVVHMPLNGRLLQGAAVVKEISKLEEADYVCTCTGYKVVSTEYNEINTYTIRHDIQSPSICMYIHSDVPTYNNVCTYIHTIHLPN